MARERCNPGWKLSVETEMVRSNLKFALRGNHPPRPLVPPIYNSSTYELEDVREGEELSNTSSKVCITMGAIL